VRTNHQVLFRVHALKTNHAEHDLALSLSVHTVVETCSLSTHISSASRVAGAIVAATNY